MKDGKKFKHTRNSRKRQQYRSAECKAEIAESAAGRGGRAPRAPTGSQILRTTPKPVACSKVSSVNQVKRLTLAAGNRAGQLQQRDVLSHASAVSLKVSCSCTRFLPLTVCHCETWVGMAWRARTSRRASAAVPGGGAGLLLDGARHQELGPGT